MILMGETMNMWEQGVYGKSLYLSFDFAVTLKPLYKNYLLKNKEIKCICIIKPRIFYDGE